MSDGWVGVPSALTGVRHGWSAGAEPGFLKRGFICIKVVGSLC